MALDIRRFIQRFVEEAADHLTRLREGISALEQGAADKERINELFRSAHTLKGSSRMLKLTPITAVAHSMEELLSAFRDGSQVPGPDSISLLYQATDALADDVAQLAQGASPETLAVADPVLCQALEAAAQPSTATLSNAEEAPEPTAPLPLSPPVNPPRPAGSATLALSDTVRVRLERLDDVIRLMGEVLSGHHHLHTLVEQAQALEARPFPGSFSRDERITCRKDTSTRRWPE